MLRDDPLGGRVGEFSYRGRKITYHVEGSGTPVLITRGLEAEDGSYAWRYIFDCLAGTFLVYALDLTGPPQRPEFGRSYYSGLVLAFISEVAGGRVAVISGPEEAPYVLAAAFQSPKRIGRAAIACPDGIVRIRTRISIGRDAAGRRPGVPLIEEIAGGSRRRKRCCEAPLRRHARGQAAGACECGARFRRSGALPGGIEPLRFCDEAIRFLDEGRDVRR